MGSAGPGHVPLEKRGSRSHSCCVVAARRAGESDGGAGDLERRRVEEVLGFSRPSLCGPGFGLSQMNA